MHRLPGRWMGERGGQNKFFQKKSTLFFLFFRKLGNCSRVVKLQQERALVESVISRTCHVATLAG